MTTLLSAAEIRTLRRSWVRDYVDSHPEIGQTAELADDAAAGDVSLPLTGLGSGTIPAGAQVALRYSGRRDVHCVMAPALITAGDATVSVSPALLQDAAANTPVDPVTDYGDVYNSSTNSEFWTDLELQDFALAAELEFGQRIARFPDPSTARMRAIRLLAFESRLNSSLWLGFIARQFADPTLTQAERQRLRDQIASDRALFAPASCGGFTVPNRR